MKSKLLALVLAVITVLYVCDFSHAGSRNSKFVNLENLVLESENDPSNMRLKVYAKFDSDYKYEGDIEFSYKLLSNNMNDSEDEVFNFTFSKTSSRSVNFFSLNTKVPAVYTVTGTFSVNGIESPELSQNFSIRKDEIKTKKTSLSNFDGFWKNLLADVDAVELNEKVILNKQKSTAGLKIYDIEYDSIDGARIYGYLFYPVAAKKNKKIPGMLLVHGYKMIIPQPMIDYCSNLEIAVLQIELRGNGRSAERFRVDAEYILSGINSPESYVYRGAVADCLCGLRFLENVKVVDSDKLIVNGGSQGGGLSLIVSALMSGKVKAAIADEPFMCNFKLGINSAESGPYKILRDYLNDNKEMTQTVYNTLSFFDVLNFAEKIKCPVYISIGAKDTICPPGTIYSVVNLIKSEREIKDYPNAAHNVMQPEYIKDKYNWLRRVCNEK
ncbi:MAG: acetylxylan esterase [Candidatus Wallbacteria bacterium]